MSKRPATSQNHPSPSYRWGVGVMTSSQTLKVEAWWPTKKLAVRNPPAFCTEPVLVRWHAPGEPMSVR